MSKMDNDHIYELNCPRYFEFDNLCTEGDDVSVEQYFSESDNCICSNCDFTGDIDFGPEGEKKSPKAKRRPLRLRPRPRQFDNVDLLPNNV